MSIGRKPFTYALLIAAATLLITYALSYVPAVHRLYATVLRIKPAAAYVPYIAPDSALFGGYERVKGPYTKPFNSNMDIVVEGHRMDIDAETNKYHNVTTGYLYSKAADGAYSSRKVEIHETYDYDTTWQRTAGRRLPVAKAPVTKQSPDTVQLASKKEEEKVRKFWKKLRSVKLPYTYMAGGNMELTITARRVYTETVNDTIYLKTELKALARYPGSADAPEPVTMEVMEPID